MTRNAGTYLHALDGRIRVKVPGVKGSRQAAFDVEFCLACLEGIRSVSANLVTGNVLVLYDPDRLNETAALQALQDAGWLKSLADGEADDAAQEQRSRLGRRIVRTVASSTVESLLQGFIVALI